MPLIGLTAIVSTAYASYRAPSFSHDAGGVTRLQTGAADVKLWAMLGLLRPDKVYTE
jgi:hypothetical protein